MAASRPAAPDPESRRPSHDGQPGGGTLVAGHARRRHPLSAGRLYLPLLALSPLTTAARFERAQAPLGILRDAGFSETGAQRAFRTLLSYADGDLLRELADGDGELTPEEADAAFDFGVRAILTGLQEELRAER